MAAGLGSRYGGMKQIAPVDDAGHIIIDYSIYDAYRAGFRDVVCIINPKNESEFAAHFAGMYPGMNIRYAHQTLTDLPPGFIVPAGREKPWGTAHAVLCAKNLINGPFAVINADDFYGANAFATLYDYLINNVAPARHAMVGYRIENTLSESGTVARGVCTASGNMLTKIRETMEIRPADGGAAYEDGGQTVFLPNGTPVSMNMWAFTPDYFDYSEEAFKLFLDERGNELKSEFFIPLVVNNMVKSGAATVKVLDTTSQWFGVTYQQDKPSVIENINRLIEQKLYPPVLWK